MPTPTETFLSHSSEDRQFATRIGDILEAHGLPYWYLGARIQTLKFRYSSGTPPRSTPGVPRISVQ